jgi:DNA protecting protein DprA
LAVVGARAVDDYGRAITCFWAGETARKGIAIVSGGARGVDSQAHLAALDVHGVTIAVLATGIDQVYPPQNDSLFERIVERGGALVSQFPIGMQPFKRNFILRNGLIAALSNATLVTRAAHDSGALTTAQDTRALGRSVFVLPGDLSSPLSWGVQRLVESGLATSISGLDPIGQLFGIPGPWPAFLIPSPPGRGSSHRASRPLQAESASLVMKAERRPDALREGRQDEITGLSSPLQAQSRGAARPLPPLEEKFLNVFNQLEILPRQFDELLAQSALDAAGLADALLRLEVLGLCEERPGRFFRRTTPGSGP